MFQNDSGNVATRGADDTGICTWMNATNKTTDLTNRYGHGDIVSKKIMNVLIMEMIK